MSNIKIFIAEDEKIIGLDVKSIVESLGYTVTGIAPSGEKCLQEVSQNRPNLILMDISLKGKKNGIETAEEIRKNYGIPVIFLTAHSGDSYIQDAKHTEPYGYILKPVSKDELKSVIEISLYKYNIDKQLKESEAMLRKAERIAHIGTFKYDIVKNKLRCSEELYQIFGSKPEEFDESLFTSFNMIHPEDRLRVIEEMKTVVKGANSYQHEYRIVRSDGGVVDVEALGDIKYDSNGEAVEIIGTFQDISERKRAEDKIMHLNDLLRAIRNVNQLITHEKDRDILIKSACLDLYEARHHYNTWIVLFDESGRFITTNQAGMDKEFPVVLEMLGKNEMPDCIQRSFTHPDILIIDDPVSCCKDCPLKDRYAYSNSGRILIRLEYNKKIYGVLSIEDLPVFLKDHEEQSLLEELADDIAFALYNIELEEERKNLQEQLIHSEKLSAMGQLASGIAHEFNNFLNVVLGRTQLLFDEDSMDEIRDSLRIIEKVTKQGSELVKNLGAFARPRSPVIKTWNITELIDEVFELQKKQLLLDNIVVQKAYTNTFKVSIDWGQLEQVILNFIINATHAIRPKGRGTISIFVKDVGDNVEIRFSDTGIGMNEDTKMMIFDPFFTTKDTFEQEKFGISGSGLGLSVTYSIIKLHKGNITVESEQGEGTTFIITLPAVKGDKDEQIDNNITPKKFFVAKNGKRKDMRILVVDDEKDVVELMKLVFRKAGVGKVLIEDKGKEAVSVFKNFNPDLVFLDILMPDMNGEQVFDAIRSINQEVPIIFMTGNLDLDKSKFINKGAFDFINKPFDVDVIFDVIDRIGNSK